jgi:hypothetical protein
MQAQMAADGYRFNSLIETIVSSPQFLNKRKHESRQKKGE